MFAQRAGIGYNRCQAEQETDCGGMGGGSDMSQGYDANTDEQPTSQAVGVIETPPRALLEVHRSTVHDSWDWLWKDMLQRVVPLAAAGIIYARYFDEKRQMGYSPAGWWREALVGTALGVPLAAITTAFRAWVAPGYRLPTPADQAFQTAFYLAINAPAEELFWRGTVQRVSVRLLRGAPGMRRAAVPLGWALATAAYGAYHRLGGWSWRSIAGVTFAGALFGALYHSRPRDRSLVAVTIAHGLTTAAFLSWGDVFLHQVKLWRLRRTLGEAPLNVVDAPRPTRAMTS
jgi:membrane protease YdiL (CAAX protease family)